MRTLRAILRPSWGKLLFALILFGVFLSASVQSYAFNQEGAKPRLYDLLSPLALWPASVFLFYPANAVADAILRARPSPDSAFVIRAIVGGLYSLVFAWIFLFAHQRGGVRIYRPGRLALPLIPIALLFVLAHTWPESNALSGISLALSGVVLVAIVVVLYLYLAFCLTRGLGRSGWWTALRSRPRA